MRSGITLPRNKGKAMFRRMIIGGLLAATTAASALAQQGKEIRIGATFPFSGPASFLGNTGKALIAYVNFINDGGGINGRKINLITYDDAYTPGKAVEQVRRLIESDEVAMIFSPVGTPTNSATIKYITSKGIPDAFILSGATKFTDHTQYPLTTTALPSYDTEGRVYAKHLLDALPRSGKIAVLYQNDDLGRDFLNAFKVAFKDEFTTRVRALSYEVADPTVDSQVVSLQNFGAEAIMIAATPRFAAQALRKINELGWKPLVLLNGVSGTVAASLKQAQLNIVSATFLKDPLDPQWKDDAGMQQYKAFFAKYLPGSDISDFNYTVGATQGMLLEQLLKQCGEDVSSANLAKQSKALKNVVLPLTLPGIKLNTSTTNNQAYRQAQMQRWTGESWERFGDVISTE